MKERIQEFLKSENISSAHLAEEIGVQPSGISHILSGRNNPSLDFVIKILERYKYLSVEWLLFGKGSMYNDKNQQTLFDDSIGEPFKKENDSSFQSDKKFFHSKTDARPDEMVGKSRIKQDSVEPELVKIVWFYNDKSFVEFCPK